MKTEYSVYEITTDGVDEIHRDPCRSPHCNFIGTVEADDQRDAEEKARAEYGAPIAVQ